MHTSARTRLPKRQKAPIECQASRARGHGATALVLRQNRLKATRRPDDAATRIRFYETNAFRTADAVHRFVPWIGGTFFAFR